ncbi:hypothetical protein [Picosynechococcus sp. PCC 7117]|uniref:hypothetical protein n=1 Tax=Picosynechococcus sp. PCC 7117 TaxID=195498 RepID=UPI000810BD88|nr:hypothetical protein [Picosynechococcus sp. PCC 7117]ANV89089.1 hypothetical protein AWQ22_15985 [Picosynechococcus sp. PCC 7117]
MHDQQKTVHELNQAVLATALSKLVSNLQSCQSRLDYAYARATRSQNVHIQGKLSAASLKLSEMQEILNDEAIQALLKTHPERDLLRELMVNPTIPAPAHEEINF